MEAVEQLPEDKQSRIAFTRKQISDLLKVADNEWRGMILAGACHGLRIGDACRLIWENINAERRSLILKPQKTSRRANSRSEEFPLHPDFEDYLNGLTISKDDPCAPLFPSLIKNRLNGLNAMPRN